MGRIILLLVLLAGSIIQWVSAHPEIGVAFRSWNDIRVVGNFREDFAVDTIESVCVGIPAGQRYELCFLNYEKQFMQENHLGLNGLMLKSQIAVSVIMDDKDALKLSGNVLGADRLDFALLTTKIVLLREISAYSASSPDEERMKNNMITKVTEQYQKISSNMAFNIDRMSEVAGKQQYLTLLAKYNSQFATTAKL